MNSRTAGIVMDAWKARIFKRHLTDAGYTFLEKPGITSSTILLQVPYENPQELAAIQQVVEAANNECHRLRLDSKNPPPASQRH